MRLQVRCARRFESGFDIDFEFVTEHRITALFGPSGAGKTSLLMMIAGFLAPDSGRIVLDDRVLFDHDAGVAVAPEARRIGVVFQDQRLFPHLSVEANLRFARGEAGNGQASFDRLIEVLDLGALLARRPDSLSGGERQRVALGRALTSAPELLLLDEPIAAVDEPHRETILGYVDRVVGEWDVPMLYVSHHRSEVQRLAEWVVALDRGRVREQGEADRVLGADAVVAAGEPVNLVRIESIEIEDDGGFSGALAGGGDGARLRLPAGSTFAAAPAFVEFAASDVMLARGSTDGLSARNRLPATVTELVPRSGRVFVGLRVGEQNLWAEVTDDAVIDLGLEAGSHVTCLIKTAALRLLD